MLILKMASHHQQHRRGGSGCSMLWKVLELPFESARAGSYTCSTPTLHLRFTSGSLHGFRVANLRF
jgi:hypothetical protein